MPKKIVDIGVGMPAWLKLLQFGEYVYAGFGHVSYLVGSALYGKQWRDVDVRLLIPDDEWKELKFGDPKHRDGNARLCAVTLAWTSLGREMTGLPIDFQIQQSSWANELFGRATGNARSALFATWSTCVRTAEKARD